MKKKLFLLILVILVLIQFIPVNRENPPVENEIYLPADIQDTFKRSCFDCHSHHTVWPWYSYVAPVSLWIAYHIDKGRGELNFSEWEQYTNKKKQHKLDEIIELVEDNKMPLWEYTLLHDQAKLSEENKQKISEWVKSEKVKLSDAIEE